ncbi:MAG: ATP-binding protein, partial [Desulfobacterales bacterium]
FSVLASELVIEVRDSGKSMDLALLEEKRDAALKFDSSDIENIPESGRGLAIIQSYMDELHYQVKENGNYLTMKKKLEQS